MTCTGDQAENVPVHIRDQTGKMFTTIGKKQNLTIELNGKTTSCDGMQPAGLKCMTVHLVPHLGGVAASNGTYGCAGAYTLARACASAL